MAGPANIAEAPARAQFVATPETGKKLSLAALFGLIRDFLLRFVVFSRPEQVIAVAVWVAHTWLLEASSVTPYLHIFSPTKRCGKTRLLEVLQALVCRPWLVVSVTDATLLRKIESESPTVLFDEIDTVYQSGKDKRHESLRAVLNSGFMRGARVPRCSGREVVEYATFCAKVFCGIGDRLPDTVKDRSIRIRMARRSREQHVEKFQLRGLEPAVQVIVDGLSSWAADASALELLRTSQPAVPEELGDRAADMCEPLLALADLAGGEWPETTRAALVELLRADNEEEADEPGVRLLAALRGAFASSGKQQLSTLEILRLLAAREEEDVWTTRWPRDWRAGNVRGPAAKMAALLRPYGVGAGTIRLGDGSTPKGYRLVAFADAFARYLPECQKDATTPHHSPDGCIAAGETKPRTEEGTPSR